MSRSRFALALRLRRRSLFVACPCCPSFVPRLGFCRSCFSVFSWLPVLLFAGLVALSSCSRRVVAPVQPLCQVQVLEAFGLQLFQGEPVSGVRAGAQVWFQFQCQFPAWVGSGVAAAVCLPSEPPPPGQVASGEFCLQGGLASFPLVQRGGQWGFWVPVSELPSGWWSLQWSASGQVGAR